MLQVNRKDLNADCFQDALDQANLNWRVELAPIYSLIDGQQKIINGHFNPYRADTQEPLPCVVGGRYNVIQHADLGGIVDPVIKPLGAKIVNAGFLKEGRLFFFQSKLPDSWKVGDKDLIDSFLTLTGAHDGTMPLSYGASFTRIVCENTFRMATKDARETYQVRHSAGFQIKLDEAESVIKGMLQYQEGVKVKANVLAETTFSDKQLDAALRQAFNVKEGEEGATRTTNNMNKIKDLFQSGLGIDGSNRGTAWGALNAFTEYSDHDRVVKNEESNPLARFESNLLGSSSKFKSVALEAIEQQLIIA